MQTVIQITNFKRSNLSLKDSQIKSFLGVTNYQFNDLRRHNNVRWLSKCLVIQRLFAVFEGIKMSLSTSDKKVSSEHLNFLTDVR